MISAIICAFGHQPHLHASVAALSASQGVAVEVIVVDNGSPDCAGLPPEVLVVSPGENLGFAGGCNRGAAHASGDVVVFVTSARVRRTVWSERPSCWPTNPIA